MSFRINTWILVELEDGINYHTREDAELEKSQLEEMGIGNIYEIEEVDAE